MLWVLFKRTFLISALTFGGGYVIVPLMKKTFVEELGWIDEDEMLDLIAIAQSSPGAIAINTSIAVGYRVMGVRGGLVALVATFLPPMLILMGMFVLYDTIRENPIIANLLIGMQVGVCAVISDVIIDLILGIHRQKSFSAWFIFGGALLLAIGYQVNLLVIIVVMTCLGIIANLIEKWVTHKNVI